MGTLFGGGESFDLNIAKELSKRGHNIIILTAKNLIRSNVSVEDLIGNYDNIKIKYIKVPNVRKLSYYTQAFSKLSAIFYYIDSFMFEILSYLWIKKNIKDIEIIQCCSLFFLPELLIKNINNNIKILSWLPGIPSNFAKKQIRKLINYENFTIFTHGDPYNYVKRTLQINNIYEILPGYDTNVTLNAQNIRTNIERELKIDNNLIIGITVSRLIPIKGLDFLVNALAEIIKDFPYYHHIILGDGPIRNKLTLLIEERGIKKNVHLLGYKSNSEIHNYLHSSDLFILTSKYESFSIAIIEAMAHGLPIIATNVGYLKNLIEYSNAGLLINYGSVDELVIKIKTLLVDKKLRNELGVNGKKFAQKLTWENAAIALESLYKR
jgi:glycosyltransferase involved in cell wall biosynthesis